MHKVVGVKLRTADLKLFGGSSLKREMKLTLAALPVAIAGLNKLTRGI